MLLVVQHPIADLRPLVGADCGAVHRPVWGLPTPQRDYVRATGRVLRRPRGGLDDWAGEDVYGDASRAIRFENQLLRHQFNIAGKPARVRSTFRRYLSSGCVGRFEVGLGLETKGSDFLAIAAGLAPLPVQVRSGRPVPLIGAGAKLATHLMNATTLHTSTSAHAQGAQPAQARRPATLSKWWVTSGDPLILLDFDEREAPKVMPPQARPVDLPLRNVRLWHTWMKLGNGAYGAWLLQHGTSDPNEVRRLRINVSRLHAERQCLRIVLQAIANNGPLKITKASSNALQHFLNDAVAGLEHPKRFGVAQSAILEASMYAFDEIDEGQTKSLEEMRRQVSTRVEHFIREQHSANVRDIYYGDVMSTNNTFGNVTGPATIVTGNNAIVGNQLINSTINTALDSVAKSSTANDDMKAALEALIKQVEALVPELPEERKAQALSDIEMLTKEAASPAPRKKILEITGEGLIDAAKTVAKMAPSIAAAVGAVLTLLV